MAVVTGDGIVGLVEEVYPAAAKVMLITSSRCKIGARILRAIPERLVLSAEEAWKICL